MPKWCGGAEKGSAHVRKETLGLGGHIRTGIDERGTSVGVKRVAALAAEKRVVAECVRVE